MYRLTKQYTTLTHLRRRIDTKAMDNNRSREDEKRRVAVDDKNHCMCSVREDNPNAQDD
jgi:hypothetical protein